MKNIQLPKEKPENNKLNSVEEENFENSASTAPPEENKPIKQSKLQNFKNKIFSASSKIKEKVVISLKMKKKCSKYSNNNNKKSFFNNENINKNK